jgi:hypothetical protein
MNGMVDGLSYVAEIKQFASRFSGRILIFTSPEPEEKRCIKAMESKEEMNSNVGGEGSVVADRQHARCTSIILCNVRSLPQRCVGVLNPATK